MGSQIVRILDSIQHDDERALAATRCHNVIEIAVLFAEGRGHQSLMRGVAGNFVKFLTRQDAYWNANLAALVNHTASGEYPSALWRRRPIRSYVRAP